MHLCVFVSITTLLAASALLGCGSDDSDESPSEDVGTDQAAIIGGSADHTHKNVGFFWRKSTKQEWCTGTLIAPDQVLTAAHCFTPDPGEKAPKTSDFEFFLTPYDAATSVIAKSTIKRWSIHPRYNDDTAHDMAVVFLKNKITAVKPARLGRIPDGALGPVTDPKDQYKFDITGFGKNKKGNDLKRRKATVYGKDESYGIITVRWGSGITCYGDSGSPLLMNHRSVVGVDSRGNSCGTNDDEEYASYYPDRMFVWCSAYADSSMRWDCYRRHGAAPK